MRKLKSMVDEGMVPAVMYDQESNSVNLKIPANHVEVLLSNIEGTPLVEITIDGKDQHLAFLKEVQMDLRRNSPRHLSFMSLAPDKKAVFDVEIVLTGESPAVRNNLGILLIPRNSVELRGLPKDIPTHIELDISSLGAVGDVLSIKDLTIPDGLEFIHEGVEELPIALVQPFQKTVEEEKAEEEAAEPAEEPEEGEDGTTDTPAGEEGAESTEPAGETEEPAE